VTLRPIVTYLIVFDLTFGFLAGWVLLLICLLLGAPAAVVVVAALVGAAVAVTSWLRTSIQFTADDLAFTMLLWPRRIPWADVRRVTWQDNYDSDADPEAVTHRRVLIRYRRDPGSPVPPVRPPARDHPRGVRGARLPAARTGNLTEDRSLAA
jgi:hypothetical protein